MKTADETCDFTDREFEIIFAMCSRLSKKEIAQQYGTTQEIVGTIIASIYDKTGLSTRLELVEFAKTALRRRLRGSPE